MITKLPTAINGKNYELCETALKGIETRLRLDIRGYDPGSIQIIMRADVYHWFVYQYSLVSGIAYSELNKFMGVSIGGTSPVMLSDYIIILASGSGSVPQ